MLRITVIVPVDKTNFESMRKKLNSHGMVIRSINHELGLFHGEVVNEDKAKELSKFEEIGFVNYPISHINE